MSIYITKPGVLPKTRVFYCTCRNCKCEFNFNPADATLIPDQRDGDYLSIPCPTCGKECTVAARSAP